jgi:hypothetical protein
MRSATYIFGAVFCALLASAVSVRAQQQPGDQQQQTPDANTPDTNTEQPTEPIPAIRSPLAGAADNGQAVTNEGQLQPDTNSITGVEPVGLGAPAMTHSYWLPRVAFAGTADSNPNYGTGSADWTAWVSVVGGVDVHKVSDGSDLMLGYTGGGMFASGQDVENGVIQQLSLRERLLFHRSTVTIFEQLGYLPESSLGFAGTAGSGVPGLGGSIGVGTGYTPGQSILTPRGQQLTNSTAVEWDYKLTRRASITLVGSYSLLHFFENDLANYGDASFQLGYNYQLTRKDTIAASYQFSAIRYSNLGQSINSNVVQGVYSRRVTGKLGFQIAAGPQYITSDSAITGTPTTPTTTGSISSLYWTLNTSITYALKQVSLSGSYNHGVTGGSGVLIGAVTDVLSGTVSTRLSRASNAGFNFGYSRNDGFLVGDSTQSQTFDYWFAGANITRTLGRSIDIFANYQLQYQNSSANGCVGTACAQDVVRNQFSVGVNLHKQPIPF